ncbi:hypothetical protein H2203_007457 [Taxawa tesnikishii (nom. ined.)]|nr:hypothetical protein H2203_007457 [Dothideales sp. JES 119]
MPVTIKPSSHGASIVPSRDQGLPFNAGSILSLTCTREEQRWYEPLQSSFEDLDSSISPSSNGFVRAAIKAYSRHHHLHIRPEDVWLAILTQFSAYVNAHAEEMREKFVAHEGQKELCLIYDTGDRFMMDFGVFAEDMGRELEKNVVDPVLREWIIPNFSTTTKHDVVTASIVMMSTLQKYFSYTCMLACGLPTVTLLGKKQDWQTILTRLEKLLDFGEEPTAFVKLLRPIISRFVHSFDAPSSPETVDFWQRIVGVNNQMSGATIYSGWIVAFCFWDQDGKSLHKRYARSFSYTPEEFLELDGILYHHVSEDDVPPGWTRVPVKVDDNGKEIETIMVAGSIGIAYDSSGQENQDGELGVDILQPASGWLMFQKSPVDGGGDEQEDDVYM